MSHYFTKHVPLCVPRGGVSWRGLNIGQAKQRFKNIRKTENLTSVPTGIVGWSLLVSRNMIYIFCLNRSPVGKNMSNGKGLTYIY